MVKVTRGEVRKRSWIVCDEHGRPSKPCCRKSHMHSAWGWSLNVDGKQVRKQGFLSQDEAQTALDAFRVEKLAPSVPKAATISLKDGFDRFFVAKARKRTLRNDRRQATHLMSVFGETTLLTEITAGKVSAYQEQRLSGTSPRTGRPLTAAAINRPLALLRSLLTLAHRKWQLLPEVPHIEPEKEPEGKVVWLEPDAEGTLVAAARASRNVDLGDVVVLAIETGMRQAEILGLEWSWIDMTRGVISLASRSTKSKRRREVPMRQVVYDVLAARRKSNPDGEYVFAHRDWDHYRTAFETVAAKVATSPDGALLTFHGLRHHFASQFVMRGGSIQALSKILGHATLAMTMRYSHLSQDHLRDEIAKTERRQLSTPAAHEVVESLAANGISA
jgi:integrase